MYPFNTNITQLQQRSDSPQRAQPEPHPLNPDFRFPPLPPSHHTPHRSISQPQPPHRPQIHSLGHNRHPTLNPDASLFTYRPLEVSSPIDNGFQRLKRYHDDPSALGVDFVGNHPTLGGNGSVYGSVESQRQQSHPQIISPRKAALGQTLNLAEFDGRQSWSQQTAQSAMPHFIPAHGSSPSVSPIPRGHDPSPSMSGSRYLDGRSSLGVAHSLRTSPIPEQPHPIIPQSSLGIHMQTPPQMIRAWTLDSSSRSSLSPLAPSHESLPLTLSPLARSPSGRGHPHLLPGQTSPSHSATSAPVDGKRYRSEPITRMASYSPNGRNLDRDGDDAETDRRYRSFKGREGGPPKARLGGAGGKTYEEMVAERSLGTSTPAAERIGLETSRKSGSTGEYKWKGNPINIKLPPERYSPPDSPPKPLPAVEEGQEPLQPEPKLPRKEAFPWPGHKVRISATGTPLPLSPGEPSEDTVRRPSIVSTAVTDDGQEGIWRGKEVLVSVPDEQCWERLRPPTTEPECEPKEKADIEQEPEEEVSAVLQPLPPSDDEISDSCSAGSVDVVEDTVLSDPRESFPEKNMFTEPFKAIDVPWDEIPESPIKRHFTPTKRALENIDIDADQTPYEKDVKDRKDSLFSPIPHSSLPAKPTMTDDPPFYSSPVTSDTASPSRKNFSIKGLANNDFLKRSLGEVLEVTTSTPSSKPRSDGLGPGPNNKSCETTTATDNLGTSKLRIIGQMNNEKDRDEELEEVNLTPLDSFPSKMRAWGRSPSPPHAASPEEPNYGNTKQEIPEQAAGEPAHDAAEEGPRPPSWKLRAWTPSPAFSERSLFDNEDQLVSIGGETQIKPQAPSSPPDYGKTHQNGESVSKLRAWTPSPPVSPGLSPAPSPDCQVSRDVNVRPTEEHYIRPPVTSGLQPGFAEEHVSSSKLRTWTPSPLPSALSPSQTPAALSEGNTNVNQSSKLRGWNNDSIDAPTTERSESRGFGESKMRAWGLDDTTDPQKDDNDKRSRPEENTDGGQPANVTERSMTLEEARQKALASRKSKRRAEEVDPALHVDSPSADPKRAPALDEMRRGVIASRERKGSSFVQKQLGGLLKGAKASLPSQTGLEPTKLDKAFTPMQPKDAEIISSQEEMEPCQNGSREGKPDAFPSEAKRLRPNAAAFQPPSLTTGDGAAGRLRPTAEAWRPLRSLTIGKRPSFGAIGLTARQQMMMPSAPVPPMVYIATPFVPQTTSFTWIPPATLPPQQPSLPINMPSMARSTTFHPPFVPRPNMTGRGLSDFAFDYPARGSDSDNTRVQAQPVDSDHDSTVLKPTAVPFVPFKFGAKEGVRASEHRRKESVASTSESQPKLSAVAAEFAPSFAIAQDPPSSSQQDGLSRKEASSETNRPAEDGKHTDLLAPASDHAGQGFPAHNASLETDLPFSTPTKYLSSTSSHNFVQPPSSTDRPVLSPAAIRYEEEKTGSKSETIDSKATLGVIHQRGRTDTVAFGPPSCLTESANEKLAEVGAEESFSSTQKRETVPGQREEIDTKGSPQTPANGVSGLYENPSCDDLFERAILEAMSDDSSDSAFLSWRTRAPHLPTPESGNCSEAGRPTSSQTSSRAQSHERILRFSRWPSFRREENSYRSRDLPPPPVVEAVIPLHEVTIHSSQPVQIPLSAVPLRTGGDLPDAPVSAHTHAPSSGSVVSHSDSVQMTSIHRPLPPIPQPQEHGQKASNKRLNPSAEPFIFGSPAKTEETHPQTTGDTFGSAAYQTADGSPLVPTRTLVEDSIIRPYRPLPDIPAPRQSDAQEQFESNGPAETDAKTMRQAENEVNYVEDQEESSSDDEVTLLIYPHVDIDRRRNDNFARSAAPSPDLSNDLIEPADRAENEHQGPSQISRTVDDGSEEEQQDDRQKFRQWAFPSSTSGGDLNPSHTSTALQHIPPNDVIEGESVNETVGIASTLDSRSSELDQLIRSEDNNGPQPQDTFRRTSVEFPFGAERRRLGVVNVSDSGELPAPRPVQTSDKNTGQHVPTAQASTDALAEILEILKQRREAEEDWKSVLNAFKGDMGAPMENMATMNDSKSSDNPGVMEQITCVLEEHTRLLTSIQEKSTSTQKGNNEEAELDQSRSKEVFAAILTGQHAILNKFDEITSAHNEDTARLHEAISALQAQVITADELTRTRSKHDDAIRAFKEELEDARISVSESRAQADVLRQRLIDTRQDRDDLRHELYAIKSRLEEAHSNERRMEGEVDGIVGRALAAELERDALAKAVAEARDSTDSLRAEIGEWKEEKESSRLALAEKESEIVAVQAQLHAHLSIAREREQNTPLEPNASASALAELSQAAVTFQEEVMARFGKLDEHMHETMGSRVKEYEAVLDRNRILQGEVDGLRGRLEDSADRFARLQLNTTNSLSRAEVERRSLSEALEAEQSKRLEAESKLDSMAKELERVKKERMNYQLIAAEREAIARQNEIRFRALTQENVYWRQFALEHDRRRFKHYLSTQPFKGIQDPDRPQPPPKPEPNTSLRPASDTRDATKTGDGAKDTENGNEGVKGYLTPKNNNPLGLADVDGREAGLQTISAPGGGGGTWYDEDER
ncbi:hypothetical protein I317_05361 [Kwoniella heveanensis CBS 569]|nr:hypothetical protein I317_05361 [Kwoniella heveanensis CBS 569]